MATLIILIIMMMLLLICEFQVLGGWIVKRSRDFTPQGVATVANAYAKVLLREDAIYVIYIYTHVYTHTDTYTYL